MAKVCPWLTLTRNKLWGKQLKVLNRSILISLRQSIFTTVVVLFFVNKYFFLKFDIFDNAIKIDFITTIIDMKEGRGEVYQNVEVIKKNGSIFTSINL